MVKKPTDLWNAPVTSDPVLDKLDISKPWPPMTPEEKAKFLRKHKDKIEERLKPFRPRRARRCPNCKKAI